MFDKPINSYEIKDRKMEIAIRQAIQDKTFSPQVLFAMIAESPEKMMWAEDFVKSEEFSFFQLKSSFDKIRPSLNNAEFERRVLISLIKRPDCPKQTAQQISKEVYGLEEKPAE